MMRNIGFSNNEIITMKKSSQAVLYRRPAFLLRLISHVLICLQLSLPFTNNIFAALAAVPTPTTVKSESRLEAEPSRGEAFVKPNWAQGEAEIRSARIFVMPLVPTGPTSIEENVALQAALEQFKKRTAQDDASSLLAFIEKHLESPWKGALQFNLGLLFRRTGHFTKALPAWESAWNLTKSSTDPRVKAVADWAVGELAEINARLGRFERLNPLFAEITGRDIRGSASQKVAGAREGLWLMDNRPEEAFKCGPYALDNILAFQTSTRVGNRLIEEARSTRNGTSLYDVWQLAEKVGLDYQPAVRPVGAKIVTPSVVNWKVGHYAALVKEVNGGYLVKDPTFGDDLWVSASTLDEEASGYFLIPADSLPSGWRVATVEESKLVFGKGSTTGSDPKRYKSTDIKAGGDLCGGTGGMARYSFHALLVSLNIMDTPVGYQPPRGKPIQFTATYNQRESYQQSPYTYSNLGNQWNYNWLSYIEESTNAVSATCYLPGGGVETYSNFDTNTQSYATDVSSRVKLVKTGASTYERRLPDGGKQVYTVSDGASPNNVYISQDIDPSTNSIAFHYDAAMRLTHVVDPLGQTNTLSYSLASDTNKVTRVTDPFGRYASFEYNTNGQLTKITDTIGLTSQFGYSTNDFIDTLITPYGMTTFDQ